MKAVSNLKIATIFGAAVMATGCGFAEKVAVVPAASALWNSTVGVPGNLAEGTLATAADAQRAKYTVVNRIQSLAKKYPELADEFSGIIADYQTTGKLDTATVSAVTSKVKGVDQDILKDIGRNYASEAANAAGDHLKKFARLELDVIENAGQLGKGIISSEGFNSAGIFAVENNLQAYGCTGITKDSQWNETVEGPYLEAFRRENLSAKIPQDWQPVSFDVAVKISEMTRASGIKDKGLCDVDEVQYTSSISSASQSIGRTIAQQQSIDLTTALNNAGCDWLAVSSAPFIENEAAQAAVFSVSYEKHGKFHAAFGNSAPEIDELTKFVSSLGSTQCTEPTSENAKKFRPIQFK